jgi:hypothetical protein
VHLGTLSTVADTTVSPGSLRRALSAYRRFFDGHRPHQETSNQIPDQHATEEDHACLTPEGELTVACKQFLGGLLKSYSRKAA